MLLPRWKGDGGKGEGGKGPSVTQSVRVGHIAIPAGFLKSAMVALCRYYKVLRYVQLVDGFLWWMLLGGEGVEGFLKSAMC